MTISDYFFCFCNLQIPCYYRRHFSHVLECQKISRKGTMDLVLSFPDPVGSHSVECRCEYLPLPLCCKWTQRPRQVIWFTSQLLPCNQHPWLNQYFLELNELSRIHAQTVLSDIIKFLMS